MSQLEDSFAEIVRRVIREELASFRGLADEPQELLDADGVAALLKVNKQKVYSLVRENQLDVIRLSSRDYRFRPEAVRDYQLRKESKAA